MPTRSPITLARLAGVCYLVVAIFGGFAHLYVRARVYVPGDASATLANVVANPELVRIGVVADLLQATVFLVLGLLLYALLRTNGEAAARSMLAFVAVAAGMICLNIVHQFAALLVATEPTYGASPTLVLLMFDLQHYGYLAAQVFFGLWLAPLGYLAYRSGLFPRVLGIVLIAGCVGYLIDTLLQFLAPSIADAVSTVVILPAAIGEFWMLGYLLFIGLRRVRVG